MFHPSFDYKERWILGTNADNWGLHKINENDEMSVTRDLQGPPTYQWSTIRFANISEKSSSKLRRRTLTTFSPRKDPEKDGDHEKNIQLTGNSGGHGVVDGRRRHGRRAVYEETVQHALADALRPLVESRIEFVELEKSRKISYPRRFVKTRWTFYTAKATQGGGGSAFLVRSVQWCGVETRLSWRLEGTFVARDTES